MRSLPGSGLKGEHLSTAKGKKGSRASGTREAKPRATSRKRVPPIGEEAFVVGIAASAGGLEALTALLKNLAPSPRLSIVILQHLSPAQPSMLSRLLAREAQMPVRDAVSGETLMPGEVLVVPPAHNAHLQDRMLVLTPALTQGVPKPSANEFFQSLAETFGEHAVAVVLSGTGSDGANGVRAIKSYGGFVLVQEPEQARYAGMPRASVETGSVDIVLPVEQLAGEINRIASLEGLSSKAETLVPDGSVFNRILSALARSSGVDFSGYKENTLRRRLARRMVATHCDSLDAYEALLRDVPEEAERLFQDLLISVTAFFRDEEAFEAVSGVIDQILKNKSRGDDLRFWVAGCATGEEAYSLAMLLSERLGSNLNDYRIQIFATDIDVNALAIARSGRYPAASLKGLSDELIERHFGVVGDTYVVNKRLRELVIFARHNLIQDPPFLRLDLVTCRNVLIYFQQGLQERVEASFHYALVPGGYLLLGKSESLPEADLFSTVDAKSKILRRRDHAQTPPLPTRRGLPTGLPMARPSGTRGVRPQSSAEEHLYAAIIRSYVGAGLVVDGNFDVRFVIGDVSQYLSIAEGRPSLNVQQMVRPDLQFDIKGLILKARGTKQRQYSGRYRFNDRPLQLSATPIVNESEDPLYLVAFEQPQGADDGKHPAPGALDDARMHELEQELSVTREHLQTVIEELETSNEELQSTNEELQSANEELQSTNEELETSNEELQSTNEELTTVNQELQVKSSELVAVNADLSNVKDSVPAPLLVLDERLRITLANPAALSLMPTKESPIGLPLAHFPCDLDLNPLLQRLPAILAGGSAEQVQLCGERDYLVNLRTYVNGRGQDAGAILLFWDNTELRRTSEKLAQSLQETMLQARAMAATHQGILITDATRPDNPIVYVNPAFERITGYSPPDVMGRNCRFLQGRNTSQDSIAQVRKAVHDGSPLVVTLLNYRKDGSPFWNELSLAPVHDDQGSLTHFIGLQLDVTERIQQAQQERLTSYLIENAREGIITFDADGRLMTVNGAFVQIVGLSQSQLKNQSFGILARGEAKERLEVILRQVREMHTWKGEVANLRGDGDPFPQWLTINAITDDGGAINHYVAMIADITELKANEKRLQQLAYFDSLTGLPNRLHALERFNHALERARRDRTGIAVLFTDIDGFKSINDTLGHAAGDELLRRITQRLQSLLSPSDTLARLSGDELVVILEGDVNAASARVLADRMLTAMRESFPIAGHDIRSSLSIGIAIYPHDGSSVDMLIRGADGAMYSAKKKGGDRYAFANDELTDALSRQLVMESSLIDALQSGEGLSLVYQPRVDLQSGELCGVEALVRWRHPKLGLLLPSEFLSFALSAGHADTLDIWVLNTVIADRARWHRDGSPLASLPLSLNLSVPLLATEDAVTRWLTLVDEGDPVTQNLIVDVPESSIPSASDAFLNGCRRLQEAGVRLAIDRFAAGDLHVDPLLQPVDFGQVNVACDYLMQAKGGGRAREALTARLAMWQELGLDCVAHGVEDGLGLRVLRELGVRKAQGFAIARPMAAAELRDWLDTRDAPLIQMS